MLPYQEGEVRVSSPFGWRTLNGVREYHRGIDLVGTDKVIVAAEDGVVGQSAMFDRATDTTRTWEWGNYVRVDTADGLRMYYCHLSRRLVEAGERVRAGDVLGEEGNTGYSFGSHLHFEVRDSSGTSLDPSAYLGIENRVGTYAVFPDYASLVCRRCGLEPQTRAYLDAYLYASELWRKLWGAMR
ncbi:MAG: M23 family metallopeptidase [Eubacteriales bacterium]